MVTNALAPALMALNFHLGGDVGSIAPRIQAQESGVGLGGVDFALPSEPTQQPQQNYLISDTFSLNKGRLNPSFALPTPRLGIFDYKAFIPKTYFDMSVLPKEVQDILNNSAMNQSLSITQGHSGESNYVKTVYKDAAKKKWQPKDVGK